MLIPLAINNNICLLAIGTLIVLAVTVLHCIALSDIADSHHPDLFRLTETWIKPTTTPAELVDCTMPGYTLISHPRTPRFQKWVGTLNIRSILNSAHSIALSDIADSHHPALFCLTETWIKPPTTTPAELVDCTMPGYTLISHPRTPRFQKSQNSESPSLSENLSVRFRQLSLLTRRLKLQP